MKTTTCPFCGEEIMVTAKKCKHCGKWIEKKCPQCGEWIKAEAKKCKHCGSWFNKYAKEKYERSTTISTPSSQSNNITREELDEAIDKYNDDSEAGCIMYAECIVIVILLGLCYDWNFWGVFIGIAIAYTLLRIQILRIIYCIGISIVWGIIGFVLSPIFIDGSEWETAVNVATENYDGYGWAAVLCAVLSLLLHWPAMKSRFNF